MMGFFGIIIITSFGLVINKYFVVIWLTDKVAYNLIF